MKYYYIVNGNRYYNIYLAQYESYRTGAPVQFYCDTAEYDKLDWTQEPAESMEVLMDRHALHLRNKYERLIFFWSGGTDSQTMLDVFVRNRIHIDEIVCIGNETLSYMPMSHGEWLQQNYWDSTTRITVIDKLDLTLRAQFVDSEDWIFKNQGDIRTFSNGGTDSVSVFMCEQHHAGHNWAMISGHEKPYLVYQNGSWWARQEDRPMRQTFGIDRIECFFLDPVINLKQCHMLKRALTQLPMQYKNGDKGEMVYPEGSSGYRAFARACGRHDELAAGVSALQKQVHKSFTGIRTNTTQGISATDLTTAEPILIEKFKDQDDIAVKYIRGLHNVIQERPFREFMDAFGLTTPGEILRTQPVYSKPYNLGE